MSQQYYTTIGLEIHAELHTQSKMFCSCKNDPDALEPNSNICPVCMAHPGTLPVPNKKAIEHVIKVGLAIGGDIAGFTEFDRKNYFYPDIPKGYQISQYKYPIVSGGELSGVKITRVHLEEDTATSIHQGETSLIDYNRAGVPLMELVTEPVIKSPEQAGDFGRELQLLLRYLGVSEANMEKGQMRVELNISVSREPDHFGTKVEVKNINSFRAMERAAVFETKRMIELLEEGRDSEIVQETRGWDENKQVTFSQRSKENAQDYRYFPDPDIPKFDLGLLFDIQEIKASLPELPTMKRIRYQDMFGIKAEDIESYIQDADLGMYFEDIAVMLQNKKDLVQLASNYITSDLVGLKKKDPSFAFPSALNLSELITMVGAGELSSRGAKDLLLVLSTDGRGARIIAEEKGLLQKDDPEELKRLAQSVIDKNPESVLSYKSGKSNAIMSLVGGVMKESGGSANPAKAKAMLETLLG